MCPDLVIVSGDLTNRATPEEFDVARGFLMQLLERCKLTTERCVVVPGNHDLSWEAPAHSWVPRRQLKSIDPVIHVQQGDGFLVRDDRGYPERFRNFSQPLFHPLFQRPYSLAPEEQSQCVLYEDLGIQVLALNSAWQIDEYSGDRQREDRRGRVHEDRADLVGYLHPTSRLHVIGAGSFDAPARDRPESIPRLYNLLELDADRRSVRVHTRFLRRPGGAWEPWYAWPGTTAGERRPFYEVDLRHPG
jgi:3',5'-cyclic AMP phosphodiesterase CpdA